MMENNNKWRKITIGDLGKIVTGKTPSTKNENLWNGNIPFVTPADLQKTKHIFSTERTVSQEGLTAVRGQVLPSGAICVSCIGNLGYTAMTTQVSVSNQQINSIIPSDDFDKNFVYYLMKSHWDEFKNLEGQSTTLSILNKTLFSKMEVIVPDVNTQKQIAKVLSSLDDKIELNAQINHNLEEQAKAIFKSWFVDFEPFQDGTFVDSELGQIPAGWRTGTFGEISRISSGKRPIKKSETKSADFMYPLIGASCVMGFTCDYLYDTPIIVTGRVGTHGIIQYFDEKCWPSDNTLVIQSDFLNFAYLYLQTIDFHSLNRGSTQPLITQTDIKKQLCPIAPINILADFEDKLYALRTAIQNNLSQIQKLAQLRDTLLPKLMSGENDVSEVEL